MLVLCLDSFFKINFYNFLNKVIFSSKTARGRAKFIFQISSNSIYHAFSVKNGRVWAWKLYYLT